jgi:hypothetical protein
MGFQIGKFFESDKENGTEAVGAIIYKPWNEEDGKFLAVVVVVDNDGLRAVETPRCGLCTETEFKKAVKDFSKVAKKKTKPVFASYESSNAVLLWLLEGMGLSDPEVEEAVAELEEKVSNCLEFKKVGKHLTTNLFW